MKKICLSRSWVMSHTCMGHVPHMNEDATHVREIMVFIGKPMGRSIMISNDVIKVIFFKKSRLAHGEKSFFLLRVYMLFSVCLSLSLSFYLSLSWSVPLSLSFLLSFSLALSISMSLSLTHSHTHSLSLSHFLSRMWMCVWHCAWDLDMACHVYIHVRLYI